MVDAQRALLDELMGVERDVPLAARSGRGAAPRWDDAGVCGYALAGLCPHRPHLSICQLSFINCHLSNIVCR